MTLLRESAAVAGKDLRIEVRGRYALGAVLPFAGTLLIAFGLSLGPGRTLLPAGRARSPLAGCALRVGTLVPAGI